MGAGGRRIASRDARPRSGPPLPSRPSWWLEEALRTRPEVSPPLDGTLDVDVAVVGGGYTGLWTALAVARARAEPPVALLEAREIGDGPSGRNGGFLHGYWSSLATLRAVLGDGGALQLAHASSGIVPAVRAFFAERGEDVWLREGGLLKVAATAGGGRGGRTFRRARRASSGSRRRRGARRRRGPRAARLAPVPPRRLLPRRRDRPAGAARARAAAGGNRRGRPALRANAGDARGAGRARDARRQRASPRDRARPQRLGHGLATLRRQTNFAAQSSSPSPCPSCSRGSAGPAARRSSTAACSSTTSARRRMDAC